MRTGLILCTIITLFFCAYLVGTMSHEEPPQDLEATITATIASIDKSFDQFNEDFESVMSKALAGATEGEMEVPELSPETERMLVSLCKESYRRRELGEVSDKWFWADLVLLRSGYWFTEKAEKDFPALLEEK